MSTDLVEQLDPGAARRLTERIKLTLVTLVEQEDKATALIAQARDGQADTALGYRSWTEYAEREFAGLCANLVRSRRVAITQQLAAEGMSSRAIAPIVGVTDRQVRNDVQAVGVGTDFPPAPAVIPPAIESSPTHEPSGLDEFAEDSEIVDAEIVEDEPQPVVQPAAPKITGRDGKEYARPVPRSEPNRKPITDAFRDKTTDLLRITDALTRLAGDDRFARNKEQVAARNSSDLARALDALAGVLAQLA